MATHQKGGEPPRIEAIDRALHLLEELAAMGDDGESLTTLSERTGISNATAYRALATMRARGFVSKGREGGYRLGPQAVQLGERFFSQDNVQRTLRPSLEELSRLTRELVHLGTWDGREVIYLDKVEPMDRAIRVWSAVGQRVPVASSALGRALLSVEPLDETGLVRFIDVLPPDRHVSPERLKEAVATARVTGFSEEIEENEPGVACLGFPLMRGDRAVAAISITAVASRMTDERRAELRALVREVLPPLLPDGIALFAPALA